MDSIRSSATRLEIDESIIHSQLKINTDNDELQSLIDAAMSERDKKQPDGLPYKTVKPKPGFCVKTKNLITSQKVFLNICHTTVIPAPVDLSESELTRILESDEPSSFRVPMSIGEGHEEIDKSGRPCTAYDIAINSTFFAKIEGSLLFQTFLVTISMEGLEDKYKMELDKNGWNILKNRRCFGTIQVHRIEQRDEKPFVQEIPKSSLLSPAESSRKLIEEVDETVTDDKLQCQPQNPKYTLVSARSGIKFVMARVPIHERIESVSISIYAPDCLIVSGGEERSIVNVNFSHSIDPAKSKAIFNKFTKILTVLMPVL